MPDTAIVETPAVPVTPAADKSAPVAELESVAAFRERRGEVADLAEGDAAPEPKPAAEPDAASEAGKALAAKKGSLQARIDEITREKGESDRASAARIAALEAQLAAGKPAEAKPAEGAQPGGKETAKQAWERLKSLPDAPKVTDFQTYEDYQFASAVFVNEKLTEERQAQDVGRQRAQAFNTARDRVEATAKKEYADFESVVDTFVKAGGRYSPPAAEVIFNHPDGHKLAYMLAKDPALNARLSAINHPVQFGIEIAAILGSMPKAAGSGQTPAAAAAVVSKAPDPVPSEVGGVTPDATPNPDKIVSVKEWRRQRAKFENAA